jgi:RNA ligase (TIGR02306 family)
MSTKYAAVIEDTRALARIVTVDAITPIKKADFIELATIGGWQCIVKKGEFKVGDPALYCEIDSLLPVSHPVFAFLAERKEGLKTFNDVLYSRIRTMKMKGEVSQGLLVPVPAEFAKLPEGTNLTNHMGVLKLEEQILNTDGLDGRLNREGDISWWERLVRKIAGKPAASLHRSFPSQISKSDQVRVQNIGNYYADAARDEELFEETVKADGQSMTAYSFMDMDEAGPIRRYGVCSRNFDMSLVDVEFTWKQAIRRFIAQNLFSVSNGLSGLVRTPGYLISQVKAGKLTVWGAFKEYFGKKYFWFNPLVKTLRAMDDKIVNYTLTNDVLEKLCAYNEAHNDTITVQGELIGPGIQSNYEGVAERGFYVYQVYRNGKQWVAPEEARKIVAEMGLDYIPVLNEATKLPVSIKDVLKRASGKGAFHPEVKREGIVFKSTTRDFSFKVISNDYLLSKEKEMEAEVA